MILDILAKRYGKLPSELVDKTIEELQIDWLCAEIGIAEGNREMRKANNKYKIKRY